MPQLSIDMQLDDEEDRQLRAEAGKAGMSVPALAQRWVKERLLHEREKTLGTSKHGGSARQVDS